MEKSVNYSEFSDSTIKKIVRALDIIKEKAELSGRKGIFYNDEDDGLGINVIEVMIKIKEFLSCNISEDDLNGILDRIEQENIICESIREKVTEFDARGYDISYFAYVITLHTIFKKKYKSYKAKLLKLLNKKNKAIPANFSQNDVCKCYYENGILEIRDIEINFHRKENQKALLEVIFEDSKKNWSYDEISEKWDEYQIDKCKYPKEYWRKFYNAGYDINKSVAIETQIKDFLIVDTKQVRVNPIYI